MSASASVAFLHLGASCVVCSEALLTGPHPIRLGAGCIVHPRARIDSSLGPITIGANNVLEEWATVRAVDAHGLTLGDNNVLRVGACVEAPIGSGNVVDCRAHVAHGRTHGNNSAKENGDNGCGADEADERASCCLLSFLTSSFWFPRIARFSLICYLSQAPLWVTAAWWALHCASSGRLDRASCCHRAVRAAASCRVVVPRSCRPISMRSRPRTCSETCSQRRIDSCTKSTETNVTAVWRIITSLRFASLPRCRRFAQPCTLGIARSSPLAKPLAAPALCWQQHRCHHRGLTASLCLNVSLAQQATKNVLRFQLSCGTIVFRLRMRARSREHAKC